MHEAPKFLDEGRHREWWYPPERKSPAPTVQCECDMPSPSAPFCLKRLCQDTGKPFVKFPVVVKDAGPQLVGRPGNTRKVAVGDVPAAEYFVTVTGGIKEVDCLTACDTVPRGTDINGNAVF